MKFKFEIRSAALLVSFIAFFALAGTVLAQANAQQQCSSFASQFGGLFNWANTARFCTWQGFILWVINFLLGLSGAVAVVFIVYGGYLYITAGGNEETAEKGRKALTNAVIGLAVVLLSGMIVRVATNFITGGTGGTTGTTTSTGTGNNSSGTGTGGNTGTGTSGGGSQSTQQAASSLQGYVNWPEGNAVNNGGVLSVGMTIPKSDTNAVSAINTLCNVSDPSAAAIGINLDGNSLAVGRFALNGSQYFATAQVNSLSTTSGSHTLSVDVCGVKISSTTLTVN